MAPCELLYNSSEENQIKKKLASGEGLSNPKDLPEGVTLVMTDKDRTIENVRNESLQSRRREVTVTTRGAVNSKAGDEFTEFELSGAEAAVSRNASIYHGSPTVIYKPGIPRECAGNWMIRHRSER